MPGRTEPDESGVSEQLAAIRRDRPRAGDATPDDDTTFREPMSDEYEDDPTRLVRRRPPRSSTARRLRRQRLTFLGLFAGILVLGLIALAAFFGRISLPFGTGQPAGLPECAASPSPTTQAAADTNVTVLNATGKAGLALQVTRELAKRGFVVGNPANDPQKNEVKTAAVIRHGPTALLAARTVAAQVQGEVTYQQISRNGDKVDLVIGPSFALKPATSASSSASAAPASPTCRPAS